MLLTRYTLTDSIDDQSPTDTAEAMARAQMDDETIADLMEAGYQAHMDSQAPDDSIDDLTMADFVKAGAREQMEDQDPADSMKALYQAKLENQAPTDPARVPAQVKSDDLEGAFGAQMALAFTNPEQAALFKRLKHLAREHKQVAVC